MTVGSFSYRFAFDKRSAPVDDGFGNVESDWTEQFIIWTGKKYLTGGGESVMAQRLAGHQPVILTVRSSPLTRQVTTDWRCRELSTGEGFNIKSVTPSERREALIDFLVESGVADG